MPATYRTAPSVYHFCRQSGRIHTAYFFLAKQVSRPGSVRIEQEGPEETINAHIQRHTKDGTSGKRHEATLTIHNIVEQAATARQQTGSHGSQITSQELSEMEVDPKNLKCTPQDSNASKHVPLAQSLYMHVDFQEGMLPTCLHNGVQNGVLPFRPHSMGSTSTMSQTHAYHVAH